jgi:uncharacterized protein (DUF2236 family)
MLNTTTLLNVLSKFARLLRLWLDGLRIRRIFISIMARQLGASGGQESQAIDRGYFPEGESVLREVHSSHIVGLMYGQRALLIGALDPRNYIGTSEKTTGKQTPFDRLARTAMGFETVIFGSRAETDDLLPRVEKMHERVHGVLTEDVGPYKAGTPYSANDPVLKRWIVASMADSSLTIYETFVRKLSDEKREQHWQEYRLLGELFGLPKAETPASYDEFRDYYSGRFKNRELHLTESAQYMGRVVCFHLPLPLSSLARPVHEAGNLLLLGTIPEAVRDMYGLDWGEHQEIAFQALAKSSRMMHKIIPDSLHLRGRNTLPFKVVSGEERKRRENGTAATMPDDPYRRAA